MRTRAFEVVPMAEGTVVDSLVRLEELLEKIPEAKNQRNLGAALEKATLAARECDSHIARLEELADYPALIRDNLSEDEAASLDQALSEIREIGATVSSAESSDALGEAVSAFKKFPTDIRLVEGPVGSAWMRRVDETFEVSGSLGKVLSQIPEAERLGKKFMDLQANVEELRSSRGSANRLEQRFRANKRRLEDLHKELSNIGAGQEVVTFLLQIATDDATLESCGDEVRRWLAERDALALFRVVL